MNFLAYNTFIYAKYHFKIALFSCACYWFATTMLGLLLHRVKVEVSKPIGFTVILKVASYP